MSDMAIVLFRSLEPRLLHFYRPAQRVAAAQVYAMAGVGPEDMDSVQVYDSFSCHVPFALEGFGDRLAGFEDAAGRFPVTVVPALDQQGPAVVVDDDPGDAHRVRALCSHVPRPLRLARLSSVATKLSLSSRHLKECT